MTHAEMDQLYDLYSIGGLDFAEAVEIDTHLAEGCEYCQAHVQDAVTFTAGLSGLASMVAPSPGVRERLLASVRPPKSVSPARTWIAAFSVLAAACAGLVIFAVSMAQQSRDIRAELERVAGERNQLRSALQILTEQQTRTISFGKTGNAAHGWLFVNSGTGFVFVGSNLPPLANGRTFEFWLVPAKGNPAPAGLFRPDSNGQFVLTSRTPITPSQYAAVAVSVEPQGGSPAPTTTPFLIVPLS